MKKPASTKLPKLIQQAEKHLKNIEWSKALTIGEDLVLRWPNDMLSYSVRSRARYGLEMYQETLEDLDKAISLVSMLDPQNAYLYINKGNALCKLRRYEEAIRYYDLALELNPNSNVTYNNKGSVLKELKRYEEALVCYDHSIKLNSNEKKPYLNRARLLEEMNRIADAIAAYKKCAKKEPDNSVIQYRLERMLKRIKPESTLPKAIYETPKAETKDQKDKIYRVIARFLSEIDKEEKTPEYEGTEVSDELLNRIRALHIDPGYDKLVRAIDKNNAIHKQFTVNSRSPDIEKAEFFILRHYNSNTSVGAKKNISGKSSGYFLHIGEHGIVIDPGFNFVESYQEWGFTFSQIDKIFITHPHIDRTASLESICTLCFLYNKDIKDKIVQKLIEKALYREYPDQDMLSEDDLLDRMMSEKKERYRIARKVIDIYLTASTFKKYAADLNLHSDSEYHIHMIKSGDVPIDCGYGKGITIQPIPAKHDDILSDCDAVGFIIEFPKFALVYTGDTGYNGDICDSYKKIKKQYEEKQKPVALLAHIGCLNRREEEYTIENLNSGKAFYKDHLGCNGLLCLVDALQPQFCVISEFGEEFNGHRKELADLFVKVFEDRRITFLPADAGLCLNVDMQIWAINKVINDVKDPHNVALERCFLDPSDAAAISINNDAFLAYYSKSNVIIDEVHLRGDIDSARKKGDKTRRPPH